MTLPEIIEKYRPELEEQVKSQGGSEPFPPSDHDLWSIMQSYLLGRGLSFATAKRNGWYPTSELDGVARVVIPCSNNLGLPFWQARAMVSSQLRYRSAKGNRNQSICVVWPRGNVSEKILVVCEGPMDALAAATHGQVGLATLGANFYGYATEWVKVHHWKENVLVVPDADFPAFGVQVMLALTEAKVEAKIALALGAKDLASMRRPERRELLGLTNLEVKP